MADGMEKQAGARLGGLAGPLQENLQTSELAGDFGFILGAARIHWWL